MLFRSDNPYLNKTIRFTTGHICYVTNQGVVKYIPTMEVWNSINIPKNYIDIGIPWQDSYSTPGTTIPTNPPLVSGTFIQYGQSVGGEGANVFVNELIKNPQSDYVGCYNKSPPISQVIFIPIMNSSNNVNGFFTKASSTLEGNNIWGAWAAFDRNSNDFWHSEISSSTNYNGTTGDYMGVHKITYLDKTGNQVSKMGEFCEVCLPGLGTQNATIYPLIKYDIQGRQGCCGTSTVTGRSPNSWVVLGYNGGSWNLVDEQVNQNLNYDMKTYMVIDSKPYQGFIFLTTNCGSPDDRTGNRYCVQIAQWNLYTTSNYTNTNIQQTMSNIGTMNFDQCKMMSLYTGNKYFSLSNVDQNGNGMCSAAADLALTQQYGPGNIYNNIAIWDTKTNNNGISMTLEGGGSLQVLNASGQPVFTTLVSDEVKTDPNTYIGCYNHSNLAKNYQIGSNYQYTDSECIDTITQQGYDYVGFGGVSRDSNKVKSCLGFKDLKSAQMNGSSSKCKKPFGGSHATAVYVTDNLNSDGNCFLILQDDGNMCIYYGTGPSDNQGLIWQSETNGKQQQPNPNMKADKSQYNRNYIVSGEQLLLNQFIGSTDGSIYLIMQSDGNLVLYTNTVSTSCSTNNGTNLGSDQSNAIYQITQYGQPGNMGKLGFIDADSNLYTYPGNNQKYNNSYRKIEGIDTWGNDIPGAACGEATVDSCQTACNNNTDCAGFVTNGDETICWPKTNGIFPFGGPSSVNSDRNIYIRSKQPASTPLGVAKNTNAIDSIMFQNYSNKGDVDGQYGLANATSAQKQQLDQLQSRINLLSNQINKLTGKFQGGSSLAENQSEQNVIGINNYLTDLNKTNSKITNVAEATTGNIQNILKDSDIIVLQKNYEYLVWSILAAGVVLVSMNIVKKQ